MNLIFSTFSNSQTAPLDTLQAEDAGVYQSLSERQAQGHIVIHRDALATMGSIRDYLILYRDKIVVFQYSGHAGRDRLILDDKEAFSEGIALLLARCPHLKLVVLNGCSTAGQVDLLLSHGIPMVIATSAPVNDRTATDFSIRFFKSLASDNKTVQQAFEDGFAGAKMADTHIVDASNRGVLKIPTEPEKPTWGLFCTQNGNELAQTWRLPSTRPEPPKLSEPNKILMTTLLKSLEPFNPDIKKLLSDEAMGLPCSLIDKREFLLKSYPHPLSEQLRKLMVPNRGGNQQIFYDRINKDRLRQLLTTYNTLTTLMAYTMLSQLWGAFEKNVQTELRLNDSDTTSLKKDDELLKPQAQLTESERALIRDFFKLTAAERPYYNFVAFFARLNAIMKRESLTGFIEQLNDLADKVQTESKFYEACNFMETLKLRLQNGVQDEEMPYLCDKAERQLAFVFQPFGFISLYEMVSVKNIEVMKYRHFASAFFKHKWVKLEQRFVDLAEDEMHSKTFMDNSSVLFLKKNGRNTEGGEAFLNLTPFMLDNNAYDNKENILAKLYFFERYDRPNDTYLFRHIYNQDDALLALDEEQARFYTLIKHQYNAFSQTVLKEEFDNL